MSDYINSMLPPEFHTQNSIPTDPHTHSLFFVSRTRAVVAYLVATFVPLTAIVLSQHFYGWPVALGIVTWAATMYWAFR